MCHTVHVQKRHAFFSTTYILFTVYAPILAGLSTWEKASKISGVLRFSVEVRVLCYRYCKCLSFVSG